MESPERSPSAICTIPSTDNSIEEKHETALNLCLKKTTKIRGDFILILRKMCLGKESRLSLWCGERIESGETITSPDHGRDLIRN